MSSLLVILIGTVLTNTFLLMHNDETLGGDRHSGSIANAIRIAGASLVTLVAAVTVTRIITAVLSPSPADVLLLVYCASVVTIAIGLHRLTRNRLPRLRRSLASSPILIVANCLSLGTILITHIAGTQPFRAILYALALGLGFVAVLVLFVALISRITESEVPAAFRLAPITLISAGLTALALMGFTGLLRG
jgi:Na+-translocating ferredoxin:NAD+ oxidoreductase subunit A